MVGAPRPVALEPADTLKFGQVLADGGGASPPQEQAELDLGHADPSPNVIKLEAAKVFIEQHGD